MIGLCFERQLTPNARLRRWQLGRSVPQFPANAHDAVELCWIDRGLARYQIGRRRFEIGPGGAMVVPAGVEHLTEIEPETAAGSIWLSRALCDEITEASDSARLELGPPQFGADFIARGRALLAAAEAGLDPLVLDSALEGLVFRMIGARPAKRMAHPKIARAVEEIEARYAEPLDVAALAEAARMSRYHFSRVFRAETGASPYHFLIRTRVDRAAALLAAGGLNVTEAALAVGFTDLGRFGRAFKAQLGRTPSIFLAEHRSPKVRHEAHGGAQASDRSMAACDRTFSSSH